MSKELLLLLLLGILPSVSLSVGLRACLAQPAMALFLLCSLPEWAYYQAIE